MRPFIMPPDISVSRYNLNMPQSPGIVKRFLCLKLESVYRLCYIYLRKNGLKEKQSRYEKNTDKKFTILDFSHFI